MNENIIKYFLNVFIISLLIIALIVFMNVIGINLNIEEQPKKLLQVVTIEGLKERENSNSIKTGADAFCESYKGSSGDLNTACGKLTNKNCNSTSCCILTSDKKCVAGNASGATYNTDSNGNTINLDYYYYQNKCYGDKCPDKMKKMKIIMMKNKQNENANK
jgi:hypothetical protein